MSDKYQLIPLGDQIIPNTNLKRHSTKNILDIHKEITKSDTFNFMGSQIQIDSQLKPEVWESFLSGYWNVQLPYLICYGFPIDFDKNSPLKCDTTNCTSAVAFPEHVNEHLDEEIKFNAILGKFKEPPINDLHISPLMTREKPNASHRTVIADLSFPQGFSVNTGIQSEAYLDAPFLSTLPSIDNITSKIRSLGKGSLLFKIDVSRAFRHVKIDPLDYSKLGLKFETTLLIHV